MPYDWVKRIEEAPEQSGASSYRAGGRDAGAPPLAELHLWPYRSLPRRGFVWFIGGTAALLLLPLIELLGSPVLWGLLPFLLLALGGMWYALGRSYRDGELIEDLRLWPDRIELTRYNPRKPRQDWSANPYWVSVTLHETGGPVPNYLTLKGGGREVELGAFLAPEERTRLRNELLVELAELRRRA
ncbi:DUF2244 domain-containing protein [Acidimangrovimonas pyrenivorans]|uniref:DUF2244 domain-containing protein n=1 Tax=Acidimangrovimonas pyrenivorans TaxID=2030798 RepID=A0ABV7AKG4_9RHOB